MARKKLRVEIDTPGRDAGKTFQIEEMPALQALLAVSNGGVDVPDDLLGAAALSVAELVHKRCLQAAVKSDPRVARLIADFEVDIRQFAVRDGLSGR
jgi:hypothetical protein